MKLRTRLLLLTAFACAACREQPSLPHASLSVASALRTSSDQGYAKALAPRDFNFPADHGPHPEFRTEWWYYTGNLATAEGRRFGFQLTFFRQALAPHPPARASEWAASQVYLAHFAVSDIGADIGADIGGSSASGGGRFHSFERVSRGALGLAG